MTEPDALTSELEDLDEAPLYDWSRIDFRLLRNPVLLRAVFGLVVAAMVLLWPDRTDQVLSRLIGVGLIGISATTLWLMLRVGRRDWLALLSAVAGIALGLVLVLSKDRSAIVLARAVGAVAVGIGVRDAISLVRFGDQTDRSWSIAKIVGMITAGGLVLLFPSELFAAVTGMFALGWAGLAIVAIVASLDPDSEGITSVGGATDLLQVWLDERPKAADDRQALYDKILFEGPTAGRRVVRFVVLMTFASIIATMGVVTNSTAVVIGAMLIAPLMTPLMGMAVSLVMGWPRRLGRSALVALGGVVLAISIGMFLGLVLPTVIDVETNSQILSRTSPTPLDLIIAIAAGAAGAYGLSRPDVSDSLPGVAIAIALVPPLAVVGISYSQGAWSDGNGALLLYATNMLAILVIGGITFVVTGVTPVARVTENQHRIRTWGVTLVALSAVVVGALLLNASEIAGNAFETSRIDSAVEQWLSEHPDHHSVRTTVDGSEVTAVIVGPSAGPPAAADLVTVLESELGRSVDVVIRLVIEERYAASSSD